MSYTDSDRRRLLASIDNNIAAAEVHREVIAPIAELDPDFGRLDRALVELIAALRVVRDRSDGLRTDLLVN
jgi:hypothetical protein